MSMDSVSILKGVNLGSDTVDLYVWVNEQGNIQFRPVDPNFGFFNITYEMLDDVLELTKQNDDYWK